VSVIVIYALYNALGYYEERKKESDLKDIENLLDKAEKSILAKKRLGEFIIKKNEEETSLIRELDQDSQNELSNINSNLQNGGFQIGEFKEFCEKNYTKLLKLIHENKMNEVQNFMNEESFNKILKISKKKKDDLNLFKIHSLKVIKIYKEESHIVIRVEVISEEMIKDDEKSNHFSNQKFTRIFEYVHELSLFDSRENQKNWIISKIDASDF
jgi:hypothetical protein